MPSFSDDELRAALPPHVSIEHNLGTGGQGTVYKGKSNGQVVAVKVFMPTTDDRRVDREYQLLSKIQCPHVVHLIEHFPVQIQNDPYRVIIYDYHNGGDIHPLTKQGSVKLTENDIIKIGQHVGTGIHTLWKARIVHRDVKPLNIVKSSDGRFVLVDVGLARHLDRSDLTVAGGSPGTRGYRSPEQASGRRNLTIKSDIFSLGVTLYQIGTKTHPFRGNDISAPTQVDFSPLTAVGYSKGFVSLVREMLEYQPARRPADLAQRFIALGAY